MCSVLMYWLRPSMWPLGCIFQHFLNLKAHFICHGFEVFVFIEHCFCTVTLTLTIISKKRLFIAWLSRFLTPSCSHTHISFKKNNLSLNIHGTIRVQTTSRQCEHNKISNNKIHIDVAVSDVALCVTGTFKCNNNINMNNLGKAEWKLGRGLLGF